MSDFKKIVAELITLKGDLIKENVDPPLIQKIDLMIAQLGRIEKIIERDKKDKERNMRLF